MSKFWATFEATSMGIVLSGFVAMAMVAAATGLSV